MHKLIVLVLAYIGSAVAKPGGLFAPVAAPVFTAPAPIVTAASSQVIARQYNGFASAPIFASAPLVAPLPVAAPAPVPVSFVARPSYAGPFPAFGRVVGAAPYAVAPGPYAAPLGAPLPARYAATYPAPFAYSAPFPAW